MKESQIESAVAKYARTVHGAIMEKFVSPGKRGVPDRICWPRNRRAFLIEFKTPDGKLSELQRMSHAEYQVRGHKVFVVDNVEEGMRIIDQLCK